MRKPVFGVSDQVPHKPGCTGTEDGYKACFELRKMRDCTIFVAKNKGADPFRGHREADLCLCFRIYKKSGFLITKLISTFIKEQQCVVESETS